MRPQSRAHRVLISFPELITALAFFAAVPNLWAQVAPTAVTPGAPAVVGPASSAERSPELAFRFIPGGLLTSPVVFGGISSRAGGGSGSIYFSAEDRYFYRLDSNGRRLFRFDLVDRGGSAVAVGRDGVSYCSTSNGTIFAVNRAGELVWETSPPIPGGVSAIFAASNGLVVGVYPGGAESGGAVAAYSPDGQVIWNLRFTSVLGGTPTVSDDTLYLCDETSRLFAISADGAVLFSVALPQVLPGEHPIALAAESASPSVGARDGGPIAVDGGLIAVAGDRGDVWLVSGTGAVRWNRRIDTPPGSGAQFRSTLAVTSSGYCYIVSEDGKLYALRNDGSPAFTAFLRGVRITAVVVPSSTSDRVFASTDSGIILNMNRDGVVSSNSVTPEQTSIRSLALSPRGELVAAGENWVLYDYLVSTAGADADPRSNQAASGGGAERPRNSSVESAGPPVILPYADDYAEDPGFAYLNGLLTPASGGTNAAVVVSQITARLDSQALAGSVIPDCYLLEQVAAAPLLASTRRGSPDTPTAPLRARLDAIQQLGRIGTVQVRLFLLWLGVTESMPEARVAIAAALARAGTDPDGRIQQLAASWIAAEAQSGARGSSDLAAAVIKLLRSVYRADGVFDSVTAATIARLAAPPFSAAIQDAARALAASDRRFTAPDE